MKRFEKQWQRMVEQAREAPGREGGAAPFGFAARAVALSWQAQGPGLEVLWVRHGLRLLAGALAVLVICAVMELPHFRDTQPLQPGLENTVAQLVYSL